MQREYHKSPLNYIGGKYKMLPQLFRWFPRRINTMVDLFAGGGDVFSNIRAQHIVANDINYHIIDIYRTFQSMETDELLAAIDDTIVRWGLSMTDEDAYIAFRAYYNEHRSPLDLFVLVCYSFNYQFRFNSRHQFNTPFGRDRSWFNPVMRENLIRFRRSLQEVELMAENFKSIDLDFLGQGDFLYADPPYLITTGSYNDGKRGFEGWSDTEESALYELLDRLDARGVRFALSNVLEHKGRRNDLLNGWRKRYRTHRIAYSYKNSNYHANNRDKVTKEVLITNY